MRADYEHAAESAGAAAAEVTAAAAEFVAAFLSRCKALPTMAALRGLHMIVDDIEKGQSMRSVPKTKARLLSGLRRLLDEAEQMARDESAGRL